MSPYSWKPTRQELESSQLCSTAVYNPFFSCSSCQNCLHTHQCRFSVYGWGVCVDYKWFIITLNVSLRSSSVNVFGIMTKILVSSSSSTSLCLADDRDWAINTFKKADMILITNSIQKKKKSNNKILHPSQTGKNKNTTWLKLKPLFPKLSIRNMPRADPKVTVTSH